MNWLSSVLPRLPFRVRSSCDGVNRRSYVYRDETRNNIALSAICTSPVFHLCLSTFMLRSARNLRMLEKERRGGAGEQGTSLDQPVDQAIFDCVVREFGIVLQMHLLEDTRSIGIDRANAYTQIIGNILEALSDGNQAHDLVFAV